ncbi:MAG: cytidylate kinase-like family protein [Oscillospiraceae bacterium]|nr:cytidylate kinase-like family protein [Oscillospiraceae bacterium]
MRKDDVIMRIITVSREFGSGGRKVGKRLADELGFAYYDREIITAIAEKSSFDEEYVERAVEGGMRFNYPMTISHTFSYIPSVTTVTPNLISHQHEVIEELASKGNCVIVGRGADVILEDKNPFKLFVYADMESKLARCRSRARAGENMTDKALEKSIKKIDKDRAASHGVLAHYPWGDRRGYNLCLNTTGIDVATAIPYIAAYIENWFNSQKG